MTTLPPEWIKLRRVEVAGNPLVVEFDPSLEDFGQWHLETWTIKIGRRAESCFWDTLRHEMVHAALDFGGVSYNERMEVEAVVRCLDHLFFPAWDAIPHIYKAP